MSACLPLSQSVSLSDGSKLDTHKPQIQNINCFDFVSVCNSTLTLWEGNDIAAVKTNLPSVYSEYISSDFPSNNYCPPFIFVTIIQSTHHFAGVQTRSNDGAVRARNTAKELHISVTKGMELN